MAAQFHSPRAKYPLTATEKESWILLLELHIVKGVSDNHHQLGFARGLAAARCRANNRNVYW
eukprot:578302-Amphidinium_carterae.1